MTLNVPPGSTAELTCWTRRAKGAVPPPLVGASLTLYNPPNLSESGLVFLFGGRLVSSRRMQSTLYILNLSTLSWSALPPSTVSEETGEWQHGPSPRYFHSVDLHRSSSSLVLFGGMGFTTAEETLGVLNDIHIFHIPTLSWRQVSTPSPTAHQPPAPRYAHISALSGDSLVVMGGQDLNAAYVLTTGIFNMQKEEWVWEAQEGKLGGADQRGTYRSVLVAGSDTTVRGGGDEGLSWEEEGGEGEIWVYSNYNFTDVSRVLELLSPVNLTPDDESYTMTNMSPSMSLQPPSSPPPGLRFPHGALHGDHLLFGGVYLSSTVQEFTIYSLHLPTLTWAPLSMPGSALSHGHGSWNKGILDERCGQFLVFGDMEEDLLDDYNKRACNWKDISFVDLEAFGIYRPPSMRIPQILQTQNLKYLSESLGCDFELVSIDGRSIQCSRRLLLERWQWFKESFKSMNEKTTNAILINGQKKSAHKLEPQQQQSQSEVRISPRRMYINESYPVLMALLQFIYTLSLSTPLQLAPSILSSLLVFAKIYEMSDLKQLVVHAMHSRLDREDVGKEDIENIFSVAVYCAEISLGIRAGRLLSLTRGSTQPSTASGNGNDGSSAPSTIGSTHEDHSHLGSNPRSAGGGSGGPEIRQRGASNGFSDGPNGHIQQRSSSIRHEEYSPRLDEQGAQESAQWPPRSSSRQSTYDPSTISKSRPDHLALSPMLATTGPSQISPVTSNFISGTVSTDTAPTVSSISPITSDIGSRLNKRDDSLYRSSLVVPLTANSSTSSLSSPAISVLNVPLSKPTETLQMLPSGSKKSGDIVSNTFSKVFSKNLNKRSSTAESVKKFGGSTRLQDIAGGPYSSASSIASTSQPSLMRVDEQQDEIEELQKTPVMGPTDSQSLSEVHLLHSRISEEQNLDPASIPLPPSTNSSTMDLTMMGASSSTDGPIDNLQTTGTLPAVAPALPPTTTVVQSHQMIRTHSSSPSVSSINSFTKDTKPLHSPLSRQASFMSTGSARSAGSASTKGPSVKDPNFVPTYGRGGSGTKINTKNFSTSPTSKVLGIQSRSASSSSLALSSKEGDATLVNDVSSIGMAKSASQSSFTGSTKALSSMAMERDGSGSYAPSFKSVDSKRSAGGSEGVDQGVEKKVVYQYGRGGAGRATGTKIKEKKASEAGEVKKEKRGFLGKLKI